MGAPGVHLLRFYLTLPLSRKNPVFVKSIEAAIEVSQIYAKEK